MDSEVWETRPGGLIKKNACLVYDCFKTHLMESIKKKVKDRNTDIALIPAGLTSQLQPLNVSINKPFKEKARVPWSNWMTDETHHEFTRGGRQKKPSMTQWCHWVLQAWAEIDSAI